LISDIGKLWNLRKRIDAKLSYLRRVPGEWTRARKSLSCSSVSVEYSTQGAGPYWHLGETLHSGQAWLSYKQRRVREIGDNEGINAAIALTGFNQPLGTLWEATPFSFVVDWFLPVGASIAALEKSSFAGCLEFADLQTHARAIADATIWCSPPTTYPFGIPDQVGARYTASLYTRVNGFPATSFGATMPGLRQFALGGHLAIQRFAS